MLSHLEFEQIKRALERMRTSEASSNSYTREGSHVKRDDVIEVLMPYVDGFAAPNPHPPKDVPPAPPAPAVPA